ncbi:hypothetical protein C351_04681 [Cryptococcus neoformans c8]|nr:hypothetical protein C353_04796 [Cryptococcus neoformans var. grubii AD1-83a]OXG54531.1 hypothetical protein C354_04730 [Cryptococcus neoformans var. grubii MW-RSA1955]OXG57895.1 hypothetical protein C352_04713 [Cryptococcus neoformans var. grubii CHC193]OXG61148.1 hypothetical protein C351_04681 [Cryptococcus neoformans var. grubii c8]OXH06743.1 hypothetical protein C369_04769 [Cryptococcus neoformans var. grubii A5-35-17]OXH07970.1 hypothetical protein C370_04847 [Cryptococcus neoformans 
MKKVSKRGNRREVLEGPGLAKFQILANTGNRYAGFIFDTS